MSLNNYAQTATGYTRRSTTARLTYSYKQNQISSNIKVARIRKSDSTYRSNRGSLYSVATAHNALQNEVSSKITEIQTYMPFVASISWPDAPKISDYLNIDDLYDSDEIEYLFSSAADKLKW